MSEVRRPLPDANREVGSFAKDCYLLTNSRFDEFVCEECGEMTVMEYGRIKGDQKVCIECAAR